jgi:aspartate aminotransferase
MRKLNARLRIFDSRNPPGVDAKSAKNSLDGDRCAAPTRKWVTEHTPHQILEIVNLAAGNPDVIPLWFGESDLPTPDFICKAAAQSMAEGNTFYAARRGLPDLREALADYMFNLYGRRVGVDRITVTTGAINAIMLVMQIVVRPNDNVVMVTPSWPNSGETVAVMGAQVRPVNLEMQGQRIGLDLNKLFAAVDAQTRMIFINSPNNPTGWVMPREDQQAVLEFCRARHIWLLADEVYGRLTYDRNAAPSFLEIAEPDDPLFVVNSFSKTWAMTGWRLGWLVAPKELGSPLESLIDYNVSGVPTFIQPAAIAALRHGDDFVQHMVNYCRRGRDIVVKGFDDIPRAHLAPPRAAFYAFFRIDGVTDSFEFAKHLVRTIGIGLAPGVAFGPGGESWFRLCFARSELTIERAVDRLQQALR